MKLIIDGDSTPYKDEIIGAAEKRGIKAVLVTNTEHYSEKMKSSPAETVVVDNVPQAADIRIMNLALQGDIVITNDLPLSYMLQGKKATVINSRGITVSGKDLTFSMEMLHEEKKMRRSPRAKKTRHGPKKHTDDDRARLLAAIEEAIKAE